MRVIVISGMGEAVNYMYSKTIFIAYSRVKDVYLEGI